MKCKCCNKEIKQKDFVWENIPILGSPLSETCDVCAKRILKSFLEENGPEYCRDISGREDEYNELLALLEKF